MKEWDLGSYQRKFLNTIAVLKHNKTKEYKEGLISEITNQYASIYDQETKSFTALPLEAWEFQYWHVPSGFIDRFTYLARRTAKRYLVGISPVNYYLGRWAGLSEDRSFIYYNRLENDPWLSLKITTLPKKEWSLKEKQESLEVAGAISPRLFLSPNNIYYMSMKIGARRNKKDFTLFDRYRTVQQELYDSLKEVL